jgi:hypothetical protein
MHPNPLYKKVRSHCKKVHPQVHFAKEKTIIEVPVNIKKRPAGNQMLSAGQSIRYSIFFVL